MKIPTMESDNEFDVDEPEAVQNNGSDDDWTPEKSGRRQSSRLRTSTRKSFIEAGSSDDEDLSGDDSDEFVAPKRKGRNNRGRPIKKPRVSSTTNNNGETGVRSTPSPTHPSVTPQKHASFNDNEPTSTTANTTSTPVTVMGQREYMSGAFVVLKTDFNSSGDPPIWKIDGKALLQKYIPFLQDGKTLYKNTSVYSGWTINNKDQYYTCTVTFKQQNKKEHIVEFLKDSVTPEEQGEESNIKEESKNQDDGDKDVNEEKDEDEEADDDDDDDDDKDKEAEEDDDDNDDNDDEDDDDEDE